MIPWEKLDETTVPGDGATMELWRRGEEFVIRVGGHDLMGSRLSGSERALAELCCRPLAARPDARVLVGGLGLGFTLQAALEELGEDATVVVAELVPGVVEWNRGPLAHLVGSPLDDARVEAIVGDVRALIARPGAGFDAILLDVDNGPEGLTRESNGALYRAKGLEAIGGALRPGGVLGVWSVSDDPGFTKRLRSARFEVEVVPVRARGGKKGRRHVVWVARRR